MSYKLYTDKQEVFECKIHLEGASLTKANSMLAEAEMKSESSIRRV